MLRCIVLSVIIIMTGCSQDTRQESAAGSEGKMFQVRKMYTPSWLRGATVYEVNIRQYTAEGTFNAFKSHLPRLKEMGVSVIYLMPIYPIGITGRIGERGNPYSIADFTKVNPELGTFEDFTDLVRQIHSNGMHVILDWVANHTSWDHTWVETQPDWYTYRNDTITHALDRDGNPTDWYDVAELNYGSAPMRNTMIESMKFWLRSADVDGFRCAAADYVPNDFWDQVRPALESVKSVFMIAESEGVANHFETCFQANYGNELYQIFNDIAQGESDAGDIRRYVTTDRTRYPAGYYHVNFTSNHDINSFRGTVEEELGDAAKAMAVLSITMDGIPLIYGGQEAGLDHQLNFFDKDEISWDNPTDQDFYKRLLYLKKHNKALWNGAQGGAMQLLGDSDDVIAFEKEMDGNRVTVIVNCTGDKASIHLTGGEHSLSDLFTGKDVLTQGEISLEQWQYFVLANPSISFEH